MSEEQNVNEQDRTSGNEADQNRPHVLHAGGEGQEQHGQEGQPHVLHAGGEGQEQHGQEGQPHVLRAGSEGQQHAGNGQQQDARGRAEEAARRVIRAGAAAGAAGTAESATGAFRSATQATAGTVARLAQGGMQAPLQAIDVKALTQNLDSMVQSSLALARGSQETLNRWVDYTRQATDRNARALNELVRIRSVEGLISWQTDLLKANIEDWLHSSVQIYELSAQAAKEAADKIKESGTRAAQAAREYRASA